MTSTSRLQVDETKDKLDITVTERGRGDRGRGGQRAHSDCPDACQHDAGAADRAQGSAEHAHTHKHGRRDKWTEGWRQREGQEPFIGGNRTSEEVSVCS